MISAENRAWLEALPESLDLELGGCRVAVFHGSPWRPLTEYVYPDHPSFERFTALERDFVVLGHTHWQLNRPTGGPVVVNPGSCGMPRDDPEGAPYALIDTITSQVSLGRAARSQLRRTESPFLSEATTTDDGPG